MDDGTHVEDQKINNVEIPVLLRQFSQEFQSTKGDYPILEPGHGILPPRISPDDLNMFLTGLTARQNTPSLTTASPTGLNLVNQIQQAPPLLSSASVLSKMDTTNGTN
eukprot:CAMPEP_0114502166 /NCGR_PEP_ID=MMETSP0109-20121206/8908_1 /TAXON_ID=29199 /ORGANISM="Chlorarachnion reptans, Strain CCCM449" /LENGTH=107 /DNA_ID=CAMNT_0001679987 /DNA_START=21 /DNA_END=344 /DNA_ORIENTATION=+